MDRGVGGAPFVRVLGTVRLGFDEKPFRGQTPPSPGVA